MDTFNNKQELTDEELVKLALENQEQFFLIVNRYSAKLSLYIRRISKLSFEDAEDLLQDIFIKVYLNLNNFDVDLKFSSWIYRIAHNMVISHYRRVSVRPQGHAIDWDDNLLNGLASEIDTNHQVDCHLDREKLVFALDKLDSKQREVLFLRYFEEKSYQEISDIIKKPTGTVASLINKAKKELKHKFIN